jgi:hypothetical protein
LFRHGDRAIPTAAIDPAPLLSSAPEAPYERNGDGHGINLDYRAADASIALPTELLARLDERGS